MKKPTWLEGMTLSEQLIHEQIRLGFKQKPDGYTEPEIGKKGFNLKTKAQGYSRSIINHSRKRER